MKNQISILDRLLQNRLVTHILFWVGLLVTSNVMEIINQGSFKSTLSNALVLFPLQIAAAYLLIYYQVPKFLMEKKYYRFLGSFLFSAFVFAFFARLGIIYLAEPLYRTHFLQESPLEILLDPLYLLIVYVPTIYLYPLIFGMAKTIKVRFEEKHQLEVLKKEKITTELKFLKAQIHPHFLFNTLNNLYTLTLEKSDIAPEVVIKLSEILDFILYQCSEPTVPVRKEVALIQNYIDLELLRYSEKLDLVFHKKIDNEETPIAPLVLLSIVENAFKHGASGNLVNPKVHINLTVEKEILTFTVYNTKSTNPIKENKKPGVGSSNVKRQLDLIYSNAYDLKIEDQTEDYQVELRIETNSDTN